MYRADDQTRTCAAFKEIVLFKTIACHCRYYRAVHPGGDIESAEAQTHALQKAWTCVRAAGGSEAAAQEEMVRPRARVTAAGSATRGYFSSSW